MSDSRYRQVRDLLAEGAPDDATQLLRTLIEGLAPADEVARLKVRDLAQEVLVQLGALATLRKGLRRGDLSVEEGQRQTKRLSFALLDLTDDAERIAARADVIAAAAMPAATVGAPPPDPLKLEKMWGNGRLQDLAWLDRGIVAARAVCRVVSPIGTGTGFLVGDRAIITNNHVVPNAVAARETRFEFNYETDAAGRLKPVSSYPARADAAGFATSPVAALDCTILRADEADGAPPLASWGALTIAPRESGIAVGDFVTIIQHPNGGQKKIALAANEVVNIFDRKLHYMTGTLPGSSGSPVFDERWQVVALHHGGGELVRNAAGERFYGNEGILLSAILNDPALGPELTAAVGR